MAQERIQIPAHIRWMIRRDMPEVLAIEQASFGSPWSEPDFIRCLRQRNCIGMVAEVLDDRGANRVAGFVVYALAPFRIEISNLAVDPLFRRLGIGRQIVAKMIAKLSAQRRNRLLLKISERNLEGQLFFKACGFIADKVIPDAWDTGEAAYGFAYRLPVAPGPRESDFTRRGK